MTVIAFDTVEAPIDAAESPPQAANSAVIPAGTNLNFLDWQHPIYRQKNAIWERDERRYLGADEILGELMPFSWEKAGGTHYKMRQSSCTYLNFPRLHAQTVTGHLARHRPDPAKGYNWAELGDFNPRGSGKKETRTTLIWYNCDGLGNDGSQFPAFYDNVEDWSQVTGHRWLMAELPQGTPAQSFEDELRGQRPILVHYSPIDVPGWWYTNGELQMAIVRVPSLAPDFDNGFFTNGSAIQQQLNLGYYLLVRKGFKALGPVFEQGGWWLFNHAKGLTAAGDFDDTDGAIPMWPHFSIIETGRAAKPAMSASQTMELGQLAIRVMNLIDARDFDAFDAAASKLYALGVDPDAMAVMAATSDSQIVSVPPVRRDNSDGTYSWITPEIYDGSMGAVAASVFETVLTAKLDEAQRLSIEKVTSTPDSSGRSKDAGFAEASSPLLARLAITREQSENNALYFLSKRFGFENPQASVEWPKEFDLAPMVEDIDAQFDTLRRAVQAQTLSPTLVKLLVMASLSDRNIVIADADMKKIEDEIDATLVQAQAAKDAKNKLLTDAANGAVPGAPAAVDGEKPPPQPAPQKIPLPLADPDASGNT